MQTCSVLLFSSEECGWIVLRSILDAMPDVRTVGEATGAGEARYLARAFVPDAIVASEEIDGVSTLPLLADVRRTLHSGIKLVIMASRWDSATLKQLADLRPTAYLLWAGLTTETLGHCLAAVLLGDIVLGSRDVAEGFLESTRRLPAPQVPIRLTERDRSILRRLVAGASRADIAADGAASVRTVNRVVAKLEAELDAPIPFALGYRVAEVGLIEDAGEPGGGA